MKDKIKTQIKNILNNKSLITSAKHSAKALGFSLILVIAAIIITNGLYNEKTPLKRGYVVEINPSQNKEIRVIGGVGVSDLPDLAGSQTVDINELVKVADIKKGQKVFKKCAACHTIEKGGSNKIGPNLYGITGRSQAKIAGFQYSNAFKKLNGKWSVNEINKFIKKPKDYAKGTKMTFAGLKKDKDRANVIAYLKSVK